jgi:hypothetical protein
MEEKQVVVAAVIKASKMKKSLFILCLLTAQLIVAQESDTSTVYKKRVLENTEIDLLFSYYQQEGKNAAVSGGIGTEELTDVVPTYVIAIPLNDDDVLSIDASISAYTSASSSNVNPYDGKQAADPFRASTGASSSDTWMNVTANYSHSSDDRNMIWDAKFSVSSEFDYFSVGLGGGYTRLWNEKNTELHLSTNVYIDAWTTIYPYELRQFDEGGAGLNSGLFNTYSISGEQNYSPSFKSFSNTGRNSYAIGMGLTQVLSKRMQGILLGDLVYQSGLLSTPFQRVYFSDVANSYIGNFQLADDIERLPNSRLKVALGGRLNFYVNEYIVLRSYYRFYNDDWGILSNTASLEVPVKVSRSFTVYPSYRYYKQSAADYFAPYEMHLSTEKYYTSDYDLSPYHANQFGIGINYTDVFTKAHIGKYGLKSIDAKYSIYERNTGLKASLFSFGVKFIVDKPK